MNKPFAQKIHEQDVESYKAWLSDSGYLNVRQGLNDILSHNNPFPLLKQVQISRLEDKLIQNLIPTMNTITDKNGFKQIDGIVKLDGIVTLIPNFNTPGLLGYTIKSRPQFLKLIYQYLSYVPIPLYEAYKEITGKSLILDDLSEVREFYESCSKFDLWTGRELCAYISHSDPDVLDFISGHPEVLELISEKPKAGYSMLDKLERLLPSKYSCIFLRPDLFDKNLPLVKSAILGGAFELIHLDRDDWLKSTLKPQKGLEWATQKGIDYHPVLQEYLLALNTTTEISSGYTTPYLEMMREVISELEISRENQGKKEAISAIFEKKLADHKMTPPSQKLADAMATLVRLPESQQGRAKRKG